MPIEPFRISEIALAGAGGLAICRLPGRSGDITGDIAAIADWRPALVVSMTEQAEMDEKGAAGLRAALETAGIGHAHFPIRDFGVPEAGNALWPELSRHLHGLLDGDHRVLLHCMGGLGRSGMIAMRLLVERGLTPEAALAEVRAGRPGAVETPEQEEWAASGIVIRR